jgi:hypothetical protein
MYILRTLLLLCSFVSINAEHSSIPQPRLTAIKYWGSACPDGGLSAVIGATNVTTNRASLTFTLANFRPTLGSFGTSLRMCSVVCSVIVDQGWKVTVNKAGTYAEGDMELPANATMFLRSTYSFAERTDIQVNGVLFPNYLRIY